MSHIESLALETFAAKATAAEAAAKTAAEMCSAELMIQELNDRRSAANIAISMMGSAKQSARGVAGYPVTC